MGSCPFDLRRAGQGLGRQCAGRGCHLRVCSAEWPLGKRATKLNRLVTLVALPEDPHLQLREPATIRALVAGVEQHDRTADHIRMQGDLRVRSTAHPCRSVEQPRRLILPSQPRLSSSPATQRQDEVRGHRTVRVTTLPCHGGPVSPARVLLLLVDGVLGYTQSAVLGPVLLHAGQDHRCPRPPRIPASGPSPLPRR